MKKIIVILQFVILTGLHSQVPVWSNMGFGFNWWGNKLIIYNGEVYAGGFFTASNLTTLNHVGKWNGQGWSAMGAGFNGSVHCFGIYNNELYAGGSFSMSGTDSCLGIAKWNGTQWEDVGGGFPGGYIYSLIEYDGCLYATGHFSQAGTSSARSIAKWDGVSWTAVGSIGLHGASFYDYGYCMEVWNNKLYIGGYIDSVDNIDANNIVEWDGINWGNTDLGLNSGAYALESYNGLLYAGGSFTATYNAQLAQRLASWNGVTWMGVASGLTGSVRTLYGYSNRLYIGGGFPSSAAVPDSFLTAWDGNAFINVGNLSDDVSGLCGDDGIIYATGSFLYANNTLVRGVAKYSAPGVSINELSSSLISIFPNPSNGIFEIITDHVTEEATLEIYSSLGTLTKRLEFRNNPVRVDMSGNEKGVYFFYLIEGEESIACGRFILE